MRRAADLLSRSEETELPETFWYNAKRRLLGPPMVNAELREQRLSKKLALGVLSPDGISSSAYGTEEILIELMPLFGVAAFAVILPMTGVILFVMLLVVLSYREVVTVYTRAGGSYVVARENFGPRIAQVAAVALLIDYVVTVDVQVAARHGRGGLGVPGHRPVRDADLDRHHPADVLRQPARDPRGGQDLRVAHLPVHGGGRPDDRRSGSPARSWATSRSRISITWPGCTR